MANFTDRLQHAWNAFMNKDPTYYNRGYSYSLRPDRNRRRYSNDRSIINAIFNRISVDAASVNIKHIKVDDNDRYIQLMDSDLNKCLSLSANVDQAGRALIQDAVASLIDEGCIAIVPVDTDIDPIEKDSFKILSLRVAKIIEWFPDSIRINVYNEQTGTKEDVIVPKKMTAIVENPFYSIMNEPNSTLQRLIRKLNLLDNIDEQTGSNKLDLIIQLPYIVKTEARRKQANERRQNIIDQLSSSEYGIAYIDGTEKVTQLNRSVDNQLLAQVDSLIKTLYSQLGLTEEIMNGSADENTMNNYYSRTIEPILSAIVDEMKRKFLTKTAISQNQTIKFFRDPFKLVPVTQLPDIVDKFNRNEVLTGNECRQIIGFKPSEDPKADELRNKNISASADEEHLDVNGDKIDQKIGKSKKTKTKIVNGNRPKTLNKEE